MSLKYTMLLAAVAGVAACESERGESLQTAREGEAVDTVVTQRTVEDTAVVSYDTTVNVDTSMNRGDGNVGGTDTVIDTRGDTAPAPLTNPPQQPGQNQPAQADTAPLQPADTAAQPTDTAAMHQLPGDTAEP